MILLRHERREREVKQKKACDEEQPPESTVEQIPIEPLKIAKSRRVFNPYDVAHVLVLCCGLFSENVRRTVNDQFKGSQWRYGIDALWPGSLKFGMRISKTPQY